MRKGPVWLGVILVAVGMITHFIPVDYPETDAFLNRLGSGTIILGACLALLGIVMHEHPRSDDETADYTNTGGTGPPTDHTQRRKKP